MIDVVKIGGNVIDNPLVLRSFLTDFTSLPGHKILVHGGGKEATRLSTALNVPTNMVDGRRVTDAETLRIVTMVYAGLINKRIVAILQALGCNAVGLSGADGNLIPAVRRPALPFDYGFVGDINPARVHSSLLDSLLNAGAVPVICPICHDTEGTLLNCNADSVAAAVALAASRIAPTRLTYCFELPGVLTDTADPSSVIPLITPPIFADLKERGIVHKGMLPKIANALQCAREGLSEVRICSSSALSSGVGTVIRHS